LRLGAVILRRDVAILCALGVAAMAGFLAVRSVLTGTLSADRARAVAAGGAFSDRQLAAMMADAGPGALRIAAGHDPDAPMPGVWGRPAGWARLEVSGPPRLGLDHLSMADAERINGVIPDSHALNPPAEPFVLRAGARDRAQAVECLTAAIYYEAALEPRAGQEAVAQVVLNRMRHPGYPKSVCGVVFQGADRPGCQFSFACDGSMARQPAAWAWKNAHDVATHALDGYVMKDVGTATHYHTAWIMASWTPTLLKVRQVGSQIFFRPLGPEGDPTAFSQRYGGDEGRDSMVSRIGQADAATAAPPALLRVSAAGSTVAPRSVVQGGRMVVLPASTIFINARLRAILVNPNGRASPAQVAAAQASVPMHAMIAQRAAAAQAAMQPPAQAPIVTVATAAGG
jgi:hypothetical protein